MNTVKNNSQKLKVKDIITATLLSLINVVIFFASSLLYMTPVTIALMPVIFSLVEGIIFFMIGVRVKKKGAVLIYCIVRGCIFGGFLPYIILYFIAGIIAEIILWKTGYGSTKGLTAG
ncbi:MAG: MptD family putative ECF transporter S component, partial [Ruminococcus sp.]|nr:MptD family putative ECF transporter S component [Ruminococcus sp.]